MSPYHDLDVLLACLDRLRDLNCAWTRAAIAHHDDLVAGRFAEMERGLPPLEEHLAAIAEEEEVRLRATAGLSEILELPDAPPPRLGDIAALLPEPWGGELVEQGRRLREAVRQAEDAARRMGDVAKIGLDISQGALRLAQSAVVQKSRPPAGYVRGGARPTGTAVPVFQRAWRA